MMARDGGPFKLDNPWILFAWSGTAGLLIAGIILGFVVLGREQRNAPDLGTWAAICRALGISADVGPAGEPQPPVVVPTRIAWTSDTLAEVAGGNAEHGAFIASYCTACHGDGGVSQSGLYPTLAGMDTAVIYKQLDDFRSEKRVWGAMNAIAQSLSPQDSADVAAYFASRTNGLKPIGDETFQAGHTLRETNPAIRLAFAGDPARGIPPCAACHGPGGHAQGAPQLKAQQATYLEAQLTAFAQELRRNDINRQMRTIAAQLTADERHLLAEFYGTASAERVAAR
jgi:cytochrome c553